MQKYIAIFFLLIVPFLASADVYPINKHIDIKHYSFTLNLSDNTNEIIGNTLITLQFKKAGVQSFRLDLVNQSAERQGKGMKIDAVLLNNQSLTYTHEKDALIINMPNPSVVGSEIVISIQYHGVPFDGLRIGATKFGDRSFFNENWPNRTRHWLPTIDHPYDKATSEFIVTAPAKYKVVSNGLLLEESYLGNNLKLTHWKQSVPVSSWLFVLGVAEFAVQYVDQFEGKSIETWVYAKNREAGFYDFKEPTKKVLEFYSKYVGPFAYEKLANIQTPSVNGGMETSSAIFYGEDLVNGKRDERTRNIVIHEIAHQWFGNAVTETTWDDAWLSEGFATYFTLLFIENEYGKAEFDKGIQKAKKAVFDMSVKMPQFSIVSDRTAEKEVVTTGLTYQKGAWVLHMLRNLVGDASFQKGIQLYYAKYFNANTTTDQFREEMEKASGKDLKNFFKQWLYQPINPIINVNWDFDNKQKKLVFDLKQTQVGDIVFDLPLEIACYTKGSVIPKFFKVQLNMREQKFTFPYSGVPEKIVVDPNNRLLSSINYTN
ncbi:MAG TPA: M1 family aminopeptidase [Sediminibacterium sp.]|uniref:M1 family metallopeptidase n=1 Tax=Sediminibacterium sp. TaxID=1917865 RepID=UPI002BBE01E2|nr:M1 family aminopeptidase [Sediminibacterium sp.]HQS25128.1 M1 family aminopeptidase [Sediminibacterium sp.]HQS36425.1 M1 family aminopeptidase [Sediminibacterium sp.]